MRLRVTPRDTKNVNNETQQSCWKKGPRFALVALKASAELTNKLLRMT